MKSSGYYVLMAVVVPILLFSSGCPTSKPAATSKPEKRASTIPIRFHLASRDAVEGYHETLDEHAGQLFTSPDPILTENDIEAAEVKRYPTGDVGVLVTFSEMGGKRMHEATAANINRIIAIFIAEELVMSATIKDPVNSSVVITGRFTAQRAQEIVDLLNGQSRK